MVQEGRRNATSNVRDVGEAVVRGRVPRDGVAAVAKPLASAPHIAL